jgi:hypothetical protein
MALRLLKGALMLVSVTASALAQAGADPSCTRVSGQGSPAEFNRFHNLLPVKPGTQRDTAGDVEFRAGQTAVFSIGILVPRPPGARPLVPGVLPEPIPGPPVRTELQVYSKHGELLTLLCSGVFGVRNDAGEFRVRSELPVQSLVVRYSTPSKLPKGAKLILRALSTLETAGELFPPHCAELDPSQFADRFELAPVKSVTLNAPGNCRARVHVRTTEDLLFSVKAGPAVASGSAQLTASFKPANAYAPFARMCKASLNAVPGRPSHFFVGRNPSMPMLGDDAGRLWAFDLEADCGKPGDFEIQVSEVMPRVSVGRRGGAAPVASDYGSPAILTDLRLACFGDLQSHLILDAHRRRPSPLMQAKTFIDIQVLRRSGEINATEQAHVEKAALYGLAAWNRACLACGPRALSLARVNSRYFGTSLLIEELAQTQPPGPSRLPSVATPAERLNESLNSRVSAYLPLTPADLGRLCASPLLKGVLGDSATCSQGAPASQDDKSVLRILLTDGFTACDSNENTIACEQYGQQIEFNVRDFSFSVGDGPEVAFGNGKRRVPLDLVLAHEIGHWLGVGHLTSSGALMGETAESARCISNADVDALLARNEGRAPQVPARNTFRFR